LAKQDLPLADKLTVDFPGLKSVLPVYSAWKRELPLKAQEDSSFNRAPDNNPDDNPDGDDDDDDDGSDSHSDYYETQSRRAKKRKAPAVKPTGVKRKRGEPRPKRKVLTELSQQLLSETLFSFDQQSGEAVWTSDRIRNWSKQSRFYQRFHRI
jgi:hypothetical protein